LTRIVKNLVLHPTKRYIENYNGDFITTDGPDTTTFTDVKDLGIPYDSHYVSRIVLPAETEDYELKYNGLSSVTFLLIKVTYNDNYDYGNEDNFDPFYYHEQSNYNINYYFESNSAITYPIGRLLVLNGSFTNKIEKIYLNNPLGYDVVLDVLHANITTSPSTPSPTPTSSATTITNLYYSDIITDQVSCDSIYTGSTELLINEYSINSTGYTIVQNIIPYSDITNIYKNDTLQKIYILTSTEYYTLNFLTEFDFNQGYSRIAFAYSSYINNTCRYLTSANVYQNNESISCSSGTTGVNDSIVQ
jgi:hypothetical protein